MPGVATTICGLLSIETFSWLAVISVTFTPGKLRPNSATVLAAPALPLRNSAAPQLRQVAPSAKELHQRHLVSPFELTQSGPLQLEHIARVAQQGQEQEDRAGKTDL